MVIVVQDSEPVEEEIADFLRDLNYLIDEGFIEVECDENEEPHLYAS